MRPASTAAVGLVAVAVMALAAAVAFVAFRDDEPTPRAPADRAVVTGPAERGDADDVDDVAVAIADRLVDRLAERSGVRVSPAEGRCLAAATLEVLGVERLADAVRTERAIAASPAEESALLRAVVVCVDADRATRLLQIPTATIPVVPLPGDEE